MKKIILAPEPGDFDRKVRQPGLRYLATHPQGTKGKPYWNRCKTSLYDAYQGYCAYTTFLIPSRCDAVVDHFLPKAGDKGSGQIYEWSNYRLSSFYVNCVKNDGVGIIDPKDLPENAFLLDDSMMLHVNHDAFAEKKDAQKAEYTLERLGLNSPERLADRRAAIERLLGLDRDPDKAGTFLTPAQPAGEDAAKTLRWLSVFMYEEAVRLEYCLPVSDKKEKNTGRS